MGLSCAVKPADQSLTALVFGMGVSRQFRSREGRNVKWGQIISNLNKKEQTDTKPNHRVCN